MMWVVVSVLCLLPAALAAPKQAATKSATYEFDIHETGKDFTEKVTIDVENNLEIIEVPSHNDVNGATFIHDFNTNQTLRRDNVDGRCFLTDLSRDIEDGIQPPPRAMLAAIHEPQQHASMNIRTIANKWVISGQVPDAERRTFRAEMRDMCDGRAILRLEREDDNVMVHEAGSPVLLHRSRRQSGSVNPVSCPLSMTAGRCKVQLKHCRYTRLINCERNKHENGVRIVIDCMGENFAHIYDRVVCCLDCCTDRERADPIFFPFCDEVTESQLLC